MKIDLTPIDSLIPYARNPRKNQHAIAKVAASIKEFGFRQPIVADSEMVVIAGHTRLEAARMLELAQVPVHIAEGLTPAQVAAYRLADNRTGEDAEWDDELLAIEIGDLDGEIDLSITGFEDAELSALLAASTPVGLTDEDETPEPPVDPISVLGDIWLLGKHRLMVGDSTSIGAVEMLMCGHKADMAFTDPPYGVDYDGGYAVKGVRREKLANDITSDIYDDAMPVIHRASKDGAAVYLWFSDSKSVAVTAAVTAAGYEIRNTLIWNKNVAQFGAIGAQYKTKHEPCLYCFKKGQAPFWCGPTNEVSVWDINRCAKNQHHPTQKPVELAERAIGNSSKAGDSILDIFGGSGSTLIACEKTARNCCIMELDPRYCDVIINRWQDFTGHKAIRESDGAEFDSLEPESVAA